MHHRVRHLCLALVAVSAVLALVIGSDEDRYYCTNCGLIRLSKFRTCFGQPVARSIRFHETEYHRLLSSVCGIECSHRWRPFFWNHHNVRPGESHIPYILTDYGWSGSRLDLLSRLEDPDKLATILTSLDLSEIFDERDLKDDTPAFDALNAVPNAISEQEWWKRYGRLFAGRRPPKPALQRTRPAAARFVLSSFSRRCGSAERGR